MNGSLTGAETSINIYVTVSAHNKTFELLLTFRQSDQQGKVDTNCCRGLLAAAKSLGHEDTFYWIASDGWGKQQQVNYSDIFTADCMLCSFHGDLKVYKMY